MSLEGEIAAKVTLIRAKLLALMGDARAIDDHLKDVVTKATEATHLQTSLKASILITLDSLDRIDERLRKKPGP